MKTSVGKAINNGKIKNKRRLQLSHVFNIHVSAPEMVRLNFSIIRDRFGCFFT